LPGITRDSILVLYLFENRNLFVIGKSFKWVNVKSQSRSYSRLTKKEE
jgi:hypothetical protein